MNKAFLLGRLTRDPEVRYTTTGKVVCQFTLAIDRPYSNQNGQREADFINVVVWGKQAEQLGNSVTKGQRLLVEGRIQTSSYDAKDGTKRYVTDVIADRFEYIEKRNSDYPSAQQPYSKAPAGGAPVQGRDAQGYEAMGTAYDDPEAEIPF